MNLLVSLLSF